LLGLPAAKSVREGWGVRESEVGLPSGLLS
jgi:hypothetical protein